MLLSLHLFDCVIIVSTWWRWVETNCKLKTTQLNNFNSTDGMKSFFQWHRKKSLTNKKSFLEMRIFSLGLSQQAKWSANKVRKYIFQLLKWHNFLIFNRLFFLTLCAIVLIPFVNHFTCLLKSWQNWQKYFFLNILIFSSFLQCTL